MGTATFVLKAAVLLWTFTVMNSIVGAQVQFPALAAKGLFSDVCDATGNATTGNASAWPCFAQQQKLASVLNLQLALGVAVPLAAVSDVIGPWLAAVIFAGLWAASQAISGLGAANGIAWGVGHTITAVCGISFMNVAELYHCNAVAKGHAGHAAVLRTSVSIAGSLALAWATLVMLWLEVGALSLPVLYALYGGVVGGAMTLYAALAYSRASLAEAAEDAPANVDAGDDNPNVNSSRDPRDNDPLLAEQGVRLPEEYVSPVQRVKEELAAAARICFTAEYVPLCLGQIVRAVFFLFFVSHVGGLALNAGVRVSELRHVRVIANVALIVAAPPVMGLGWVYNRFGPRSWKAVSIAVVPLYAVAAFLLTWRRGATGSTHPDVSLIPFYVGVGLLSFLRTCINTNLAVTFPVIFADNPKGQSTAYTMIWSFSGIVAIGTGQALSDVVQADSRRMADVVYAWAAVGAATQVWLAATQLRWEVRKPAATLA